MSRGEPAGQDVRQAEDRGGDQGTQPEKRDQPGAAEQAGADAQPLGLLGHLGLGEADLVADQAADLLAQLADQLAGRGVGRVGRGGVGAAGAGGVGVGAVIGPPVGCGR